MIDYDVKEIQKYLEEKHSVISRRMTFVTDIIKFSALVYSFIGFGLVATFLVSSNAPFPITDFSAIQLLVVVAALYSVGAFFGGAVLLLPAYTCSVSSLTRTSVRFGKYKKIDLDFSSREDIEKLGEGWFLYHSSAFSIILTNALLFLSGYYQSHTAYNMIAVLISTVFIISAFVTLSFIYFGAFQGDNLAENSKVVIKCFYTQINNGLFCLGWIYTLLKLILLTPIAYYFDGAEWERISLWISITLLLVVFYVVLSSVKVRLERVIMSVFVLAIPIAFWNGPLIGRKTLHILGVGGGIPVEILQKYQMPNKIEASSKIISGCMLINTGSKVVLRVVDPSNTLTCERLLNDIKMSYYNSYENIEIISSSDIVYIKGRQEK